MDNKSTIQKTARGLYIYWDNKYNDYKKYNRVEQFITELEQTINEKINLLNNGYIYSIYSNSNRPLDNFEKETLQAEVIELIKLLNEITEPEHETFTGKLNNKNAFCEWDKTYKYNLLIPGSESIRYVLIKKFDNWINHKINNNLVKPFMVDHLKNVIVA